MATEGFYWIPGFENQFKISTRGKIRKYKDGKPHSRVRRYWDSDNEQYYVYLDDSDIRYPINYLLRLTFENSDFPTPEKVNLPETEASIEITDVIHIDLPVSSTHEVEIEISENGLVEVKEIADNNNVEISDPHTDLAFTLENVPDLYATGEYSKKHLSELVGVTLYKINKALEEDG
jgi:hypothetical protein